MKFIKYRRLALTLLISTAALLGPDLPMASGQAINGYPYLSSNFTKAAPRGFGDFNNSWPQAMIWWNNYLYVGTSRDSLCQSDFAVNEAGTPILGQAQANIYLPYPPNDPNLTCTPNPADLRWRHRSGAIHLLPASGSRYLNRPLHCQTPDRDRPILLFQESSCPTMLLSADFRLLQRAMVRRHFMLLE